MPSKRKRIVLTAIITTTPTKSKQLPYLGYQKLDQKLKKIQKFGFRVAFQTDPNLNNILFKNKDKLIPNSHPGVYKIKFSCGSIYDGETKKKIISRSTKHQQDSIKGNWSSSVATEQTKECHGYFDWLRTKTLSIKNRYYDRKVRELFEIDMVVVRYGQDNRLNRDNGNSCLYSIDRSNPVKKRKSTLK